MKKVLYTLSFLIGLSFILFTAYFLTQDFPIYDRFYSPQVRNERDLKRIRLSLPKQVGDFVLQVSLKNSDIIQIYEGCFDKYSQGTVDESLAVLCEREIIARYKNPRSDKEMTVDFLSNFKSLDDYNSHINKSFIEKQLHGYKIFRFKTETDNEVLWYPEEKRNLVLNSLGWYPKKLITTIGVQQSKIISLPDGGVSTDLREPIDTESPVILYFLEKYPPKK